MADINTPEHAYMTAVLKPLNGCQCGFDPTDHNNWHIIFETIENYRLMGMSATTCRAIIIKQYGFIVLDTN